MRPSRACTALLATVLLASVAYAETITVDFTAKSARLRLNGGAVLSHDGTGFVTPTVTWDNGLYAGVSSMWAERRKSDETDFNAGLKRPCFWFVCRLDVSYWALPNFTNVKGDALDVTGEVSDSYDIGNGESVGWLLHADHLTFFGQSSLEVYRAMGNWTPTLLGQTLRLSAGIAYRTDKERWHVPLTMGVPFVLSEHWSATPGIEAYYTLDKHQFEKAVMLTFSWKR